MFQNLLVVCTGNICRSPVAEAMLRQALPDKHVHSAGLGAMVGEGVEPRARALAEAAGLDVADHKARQISRSMTQSADLILVMTDRQRRALADLDPTATGKSMLLGRWLGGSHGQEIPDPYGKSEDAFRHIHGLLQKAADGWIERLRT